MPNQDEITTWGGYGLWVATMAVTLIPKGMGWLAEVYTGNQTVKVRENEDFKAFLMAELNKLKTEQDSLRSKLDECEIKHAESEKRNVVTETKLELLTRQHEEILRSGSKAMAVELTARLDQSIVTTESEGQ